MQTKLITAGVLVASATALGGVYFWMGTDDAPREPAPLYTKNQQAPVTQPEFDSFGGEEIEQRLPDSTRSNQGQESGFGRFDFAARMTQFDLDGDGVLSDEERRAMRQAMRDEMLARFDLDGDGELSREERMAARQARFENSDRGQALMRQFDADGDGVLNDEEQAAMDAYMQEQRDERRADQIERFDTDGDGEISREERQTQRDSFRQDMNDEFDADGDGELSIDEQQEAFETMRERREIDQFVNRFDSNGDGMMDSADFDSFVGDYSSGDLRADVNGDGVVDTQDLITYRDMVTRSGNRP